jgi:PAS domain S-box-containing protein
MNSGPENSRTDELLHLIIDSATDFAIFTTDPNGIVTSWNVGAERLLGHKEEEILGQSADVMFVPEDGPSAATDERRTALAEGRAEDERWQRKKDDSRFWASGLMMPLKDPDQGYVKILRDRSAQHRFEQQLRENEELFRLLATNIPQLVFRCKSSGNRTWGSPQWSIYTGLTLQDSVEFGWLDAVHPDDLEQTVSLWQEAPVKGEYNVQHRLRSAADQQYRWHQTRAVPLSENDFLNSEWVGTSTDIHDLRTLQERQEVLLAELQHRTRNLLSIVQAIARQSLRSVTSLEEFAVEFVDRLRTLGVVQKLLSTNAQQGIPLRELIEMELGAHGQPPREDSGKIILRGPPIALPPDTVQMFALAVHELTTNALKYGALAQPQGRLNIVWSRQDDAYIRLLWQEQGVTMPAETSKRGYGRVLLEEALVYQLGAEAQLHFGNDGVRWEIVARVPSDREVALAPATGFNTQRSSPRSSAHRAQDR